MKKMAFLVAALALSFGSTAFAEEKTQGTDVCCRAEDDGCTDAYEADCSSTTEGHFCSTAKDANGNKLDYRVVWTITCGADETCNNTNGNITCAKAGAPTGTCAATETPYCADDLSEGYYCNSQTLVWGKRSCTGDNKCIVRGTSVICEEPGGPTEATCDKDSAQATCSTSGKTGWYCSNSGKWTSKTCSEANCTASGNSVTCGDNGGGNTDSEMPTGTCDPATVQGQCNAAHTVGYYCKNDGTWTRKTCENCTVNTAKPNSVDCGGSEQGDECDQGAMECTSATAGWYCNNGNKKNYTCENSTCGFKTYNNNKRLTCCVQSGSGWVDATYSTDTCDSVYDGNGGGGGDTSGCGQANYCSSDNLIAYNCEGSTMKPTACLDGKTCQVSNGTATCVGSINNTGKKDKDDGGCSATGAGFALGWLGLALIPAIRRRSRK